MTTSTPWRYCGPKSAPHAPVPMARTWEAVCRAFGWSEKIARLTWNVMACSEDSYAKATYTNFLLTDGRIQGMGYDAMQRFLKQNVTCRAAVRILEIAVQAGVIRRKQASSLEEALLSHASFDGSWKE